MTPEQLSRAAVQLVDRLEAEQVQQINRLLQTVERDAIDRLSLLDLKDNTTSRVIKRLRAQQLIQQSRAAQTLVSLGSASGPLAQEFREGIRQAYADGLRTAQAAVIDSGLVTAETAANVVAFGPRVELELIEAITQTTLTTLEKVGVNGLQRLEEAIVRGAVRGQGPRAAGRLVRESVDLTRFEAERITRTVFMRANNEARHRAFEESGVEFVQYDATNDVRTCPYCASRHGMVYRISNRPTVPTHPMCRCVLLPFRPDASRSTRADDYYVRTRRELRERGLDTTVATARAPFERMDGVDAPRPVFAPGRGWLNA